MCVCVCVFPFLDLCRVQLVVFARGARVFVCVCVRVSVCACVRAGVCVFLFLDFCQS